VISAAAPPCSCGLTDRSRRGGATPRVPDEAERFWVGWSAEELNHLKSLAADYDKAPPQNVNTSHVVGRHRSTRRSRRGESCPAMRRRLQLVGWGGGRSTPMTSASLRPKGGSTVDPSWTTSHMRRVKREHVDRSRRDAVLHAVRRTAVRCPLADTYGLYYNMRLLPNRHQSPRRRDSPS